MNESLYAEIASNIDEMAIRAPKSKSGEGISKAFLEYLKLPVVTAGVGHPGSQAPAPNENMRLDLYLKGAKHIVRILRAFSEQ